MAVLVPLLFILAIVGGADATWCVCKGEMGDTVLQKTIDYACGAGADCTPILQGGSCFQPNTVKSHCSYAVNSYYQRKGQASGSCDFSGTASVSTTDPSYSSCSYPATASAAGTGTPATGTPATGGPTTGSPTTGSPTIGTPTTGTPTTGTPATGSTGSTGSTFTPTNGGVLGGLGPSGTSLSPDGSDGGFLPKPGTGSLLLPIILLGLILLRG